MLWYHCMILYIAPRKVNHEAQVKQNLEYSEAVQRLCVMAMKPLFCSTCHSIAFIGAFVSQSKHVHQLYSSKLSFIYCLTLILGQVQLYFWIGPAQSRLVVLCALDPAALPRRRQKMESFIMHPLWLWWIRFWFLIGPGIAPAYP